MSDELTPDANRVALIRAAVLGALEQGRDTPEFRSAEQYADDIVAAVRTVLEQSEALEWRVRYRWNITSNVTHTWGTAYSEDTARADLKRCIAHYGALGTVWLECRPTWIGSWRPVNQEAEARGK